MIPDQTTRDTLLVTHDMTHLTNTSLTLHETTPIIITILNTRNNRSNEIWNWYVLSFELLLDCKIVWFFINFLFCFRWSTNHQQFHYNQLLIKNFTQMYLYILSVFTRTPTLLITNTSGLFISRTKIEIIIVYTHHSFFIFHVLFFISHTLLIFLIHFITLYLQYYVVIFHK